VEVRFVIARTARRRPTLQHRISEGDPTRTTCGLDLLPWSRAYQALPIPQVLCMKCQKEPER